MGFGVLEVLVHGCKFLSFGVSGAIEVRGFGYGVSRFGVLG